jgi:hypothetical protein
MPWLSGEKGNFTQDMAQWIKEGKVKIQQESFTDGLENWPLAFNSLFGKYILYPYYDYYFYIIFVILRDDSI